jgi:UDP-N-acetylmuramyl pentapeptide synthase
MTQSRDPASGSQSNEDGQKLSELFPDASFFACSDIECCGFTDQAAECRAGDVFIARCDDNDDGHEHIATAVAQGAVGVVAERMVPTHGVPLCVVPDTFWAWSRLSHAM